MPLNHGSTGSGSTILLFSSVCDHHTGTDLLLDILSGAKHFQQGFDSVSSLTQRALCRLPAVGGIVQGVGGMGKHLLQQLVDRPHPMTNQLM
jgi:hypothetical protein